MVLLRCSLSAPTSVALVLILRSVLAVCYFPNGEVSDNDYIPCPNSKACCPTDAYCLSNGLCWTALNFLFRASCSDQSWTSPDCAKYCLNANPFSGQVMSPCSYTGLFACDYDLCARENFTVSKGQVILRDYQQKGLGALVTVTANATTSASASIPTSSSTSTSTSSSLAKDNATCVPSSPSFSPNPSCNQSSKLVAVGAGVGIPFAITLVTALVLLGRERRKARRLELENARLSGVGGSGKPAMVVYREPTASNHQFNSAGNAELVGDRAEHELMTPPVAYELQTHRE